MYNMADNSAELESLRKEIIELKEEVDFKNLCIERREAWKQESRMHYENLNRKIEAIRTADDALTQISEKQMELTTINERYQDQMIAELYAENKELKRELRRLSQEMFLTRKIAQVSVEKAQAEVSIEKERTNSAYMLQADIKRKLEAWLESTKR